MEEDWDGGHQLWIALRIIFIVLAVGILFRIAFGFWQPYPFVWRGWVWDLFGLIFLIWLLSWAFRWPLHSHRHDERILRRRYARGEITRAQFKRMMKDLKESRS